jgi:Septum formation initiator.
VVNRYSVTLLLATVWLLFFDKYDYFLLQRLNNKIERLEADRIFYQDEITALKERKQALDTDPSAVERLAREQYLMKRDNEDLFLLAPEKE